MATLDHVAIGPANGDDEIASYASIVVQALGFPNERLDEWLGRMGVDKIRVARVRGKVAGGCGILPGAQWFGGRSVRMAGITAVGVAPEHRGEGVATALMRAVMREAHEDGYPLSALYPATYPVYRAVGFEAAGSRTAFRVPVVDLAVRAGRASDGDGDELVVRSFSVDDVDAIRGVYDARATRTSGHVDRTPFFWGRVINPIRGPGFAYMVERASGDERVCEGYVIYSQTPGASLHYEVVVRELVADTPRAARRLLRMLAHHRSMSPHAKVYAAPDEPLFLLANEEPLEVVERVHWMLRVVRVQSALEARGYSAAVRGEAHLAIDDPLLQENSGRFLLRVEGGIGRVIRGGEGRVRLHVRGLAPLYSGFMGAEALATIGLAAGEREDLAATSALFAGGVPWMTDMF